MKRSKFVYLLIAIVLVTFIGCKHNQPYIPIQQDEITIDINKALKTPQVTPLSRMASKVHYTLLNNESVNLQTITKILSNDSLIFVCDRTNLYTFDRQGKYKNKLITNGYGPNEFMEVYDYDLSSQGSIVLLSPLNSLIGVINFEGKVISSFKIPFYPTKICAGRDGIYLAFPFPDLVDNNHFRVAKYSYSGQLLKRGIYYGVHLTEVGGASTSLVEMQKNPDHQFYYWERNCDTTYLINEDLSPRKKFILNRPKSIEGFYYFGNWFDTKNYILLTKGFYTDRVLHVLYDKLTHETTSFYYPTENPGFQMYAGFINDMDGGYPFLPFDRVDHTKLLCWFNHSYLIKYKKDFYKNIDPIKSNLSNILGQLENVSDEEAIVVMEVEIK